MAESLDVRGLSCPLPVLRANRALRNLQPGEVLTILATDAAAPKDFEVFCMQTGHQLIGSGLSEGVFTIIIRKKGP